jgi:RNA methyltransferase, TrmH family
MAGPAADRDLPRRYREARHDPGHAVLEGFHALKHALRFGADILEVRATDPAALGRLVQRLAPDLADRVSDLARPVDHGTFGQLSPNPHPTGVIALARRPAMDPRVVLDGLGPGLVVLLERPTHHGNMGAVIRVAAAAGAAAVLTTGPHDPWHPAALRGGAGLQFALPVGRVDALPETDRPIMALDPEGERLAAEALPARAVLVFGSERGGVSAGLLERAQRRVAIPMRPGVSSLNLATAVAVTLYCGTGPRAGAQTTPPDRRTSSRG